MPPSLLPFLLLFVLFVPVFPDTHFVFDGRVTCNLNRLFNYHIQVIEHDSITHNDYISIETDHYSQKSPSFYNITAFDTDDGPLDETYEIAFIVTHDCNSDKYERILQVTIEVGKFAVINGTHYRKFDFDITDKGTIWTIGMRRFEGLEQ